MKLRNKKTREIKEVEPITIGGFRSLAELNEEWEDYEEPKEYWHIFGTNITKTQEGFDEIYDKRNKQIGNHFETEDETMRAVEKLKAWGRLKDLGQFRWSSVDEVKAACDYRPYVGIEIDFKTLFGGEE